MTTTVVSAVIVRAGRILLTQRRHDKDFAFAWESPGGKVEGGHESYHDALRREVREEIGVELPAIAEEQLWHGDFSSIEIDREDRRDVFLLMFPANIAADAVPAPREGQGLGWFTIAEMLELTLAPANQRALDEIVDYMKKCAWRDEMCSCGSRRGEHQFFTLRSVPCERFELARDTGRAALAAAAATKETP